MKEIQAVAPQLMAQATLSELVGDVYEENLKYATLIPESTNEDIKCILFANECVLWMVSSVDDSNNGTLFSRIVVAVEKVSKQPQVLPRADTLTFHPLPTLPQDKFHSEMFLRLKGKVNKHR